MFGHAVRGPLLLFKEKWLDEEPEKISVLKFVATFKDIFRSSKAKRKYDMTKKQSQGVLNLEIEYWFCSLLEVIPCRQSTLEVIKWLRKLVTQITWSKLLVDIRKHKCDISVCSKHIMKNQNQN